MSDIQNNSTFCILPWLHFNVQTNGDAYPCCNIKRNEHTQLGNLHETSVDEVVNHANLRSLRRRMLNNEISLECSDCYETEASGCPSKRQRSNKDYQVFIDEAAKTGPDGSVANFKLRNLALHISNLCNFKCRTCGPNASTAWIPEMKQLNPFVYYTANGYANRNQPESLWKNLKHHLDSIDTLYFAGGEPLLLKEHYKILQFLAEKKMFHVKLTYNTNFSTLSSTEQSVIDLWNRFSYVFLSISLDGAGSRGEYIRKGLRWSEIFERREELRKKSPHVGIQISATLSVFNALHLPDLHAELVHKNFIKPNEFHISYLYESKMFSAQILPASLKQKAQKIYQDYDEVLNQYQSIHQIDTASIRQTFQMALGFILAKDQSELIPKFLKFTNNVDTLRSENFDQIFPELSDLKN
jgi:radical SAM protein with 4Fe4S-binding SPASM domain